MPIRNLRIDDALWERLRRTAAREHRRSISDMARVALAAGLEEFDRRWKLLHPAGG
jgi:plasmid stability protein